MIHKSLKKVSTNFYCEKCDYYANRKCDLNKHFKSKKHNDTNDTYNDTKKFSHECECGKTYKYHTGLSRHKKQCHIIQKALEIVDHEVSPSLKSMEEMFMELMEKNQELQEQIIELSKEPKTIIQTQNNNTNNSFNLNNFLNVDCKDAMNLSDFLETIQYTFKDLLHLGEQGFVKSIQNTFVKQLGDMDQTKRPIHCTDKKRKTMYVKDEDKWEKDCDNEKISSTIKTMNKKQLSAFSIHSKNRPDDYLDSDHNIYTQDGIIQQMCGYTNDTSCELNKKILKNLVNIVDIKK